MKFQITSGSYKSLETGFSWDEIPNFAILTGENGVGKTQLLEIMNLHLNPKSLQNIRSQFPDLNAAFVNPSFKAHEVLYINNFSQPQGTSYVSLGNISNDVNNLYNAVTGKRKGKVDNPLETERISKIEKQLENKGLNLSSIDEDTFIKNLPSGFLFWDANQIYRDLAYHLYNYHIETISLKAKGYDTESIKKEIGPAPWDTLNQRFNGSSLRYRLQTPQDMNIRSSYKLSLIDDETKQEILPENLSSGEITLLRLYLWLFIAKNKYSFPKLVLLDEPDSHLHPAFIKDFIDSIKSGLVDLGTQVIMSSHRTETIAFAPNDCIFEMYSKPARVEKSSDKGKTISLLTRNLVTIVGDTRTTFVEDEDDKKFYNIAFDLFCSENSNQKFNKLVFVPVSLGKGKNRDSGGKSKVIHWVHKLRSAGLYSVLLGIVDRDNKTNNEDNIYTLNRYSIENYLLDPLNIFAVLLDNKSQPKLKLSTEILYGEECKIRDLPETDMQIIADSIVSDLAKNLNPPITEDEKTNIKIEYSNGKSLNVQKWLIERKGHLLISIANKKWKNVQPTSLLKVFEKVRLLPKDCVNLFNEICK